MKESIMKKGIAVCLVACTLATHSNTFGMLTRTAAGRKARVTSPRKYCKKNWFFSTLNPNLQQEFIDDKEAYKKFSDDRHVRNERLLRSLRAQNSKFNDFKNFYNKDIHTLTRDDFFKIANAMNRIEGLESTLQDLMKE